MHRRSSLPARCLRVLEGGLVLTSLILLVFVIVLAVETWRAPWRDPSHKLMGRHGFAYISKIQDQGTFEAATFITRPGASDRKFLWQPRLGPVSLGFSGSADYVAGHVTMPFWLAGVLGGLAPAYIVVRRLTRKGPRACDCQACGYDLTGNTSGVCPECGQRIAGTTGGEPAPDSSDAGLGGKP